MKILSTKDQMHSIFEMGLPLVYWYIVFILGGISIFSLLSPNNQLNPGHGTNITLCIPIVPVIIAEMLMKQLTSN